jgi:hypothetical protein
VPIEVEQLIEQHQNQPADWPTYSSTNQINCAYFLSCPRWIFFLNLWFKEIH